MATLKLTIFKAKVLKDGKHKIRIAVCHKQETCYIITRFKIDSLSQFKNGQVVKRPDAAMINTKLRNMLNEYQEKLDLIKKQSLYNCKQIRDMLITGINQQESKSLTYQDACMRFIAELNKEGRLSYAILLERSCRYFTEFTHGGILLSDITPEIITSFSKFLSTKKRIGTTTIGMMMSQLKAVINRSIYIRVVKYEVHPFIATKIAKSPIREVDISLKSLNLIRCTKLTKRKFIVARDIFMLSFYLGGINLIDMLSLNLKGRNNIEYVRTKTRFKTQDVNYVTLPIPPAAKDIIDKWLNKNTGKLDFGYKFSYHNFSRYVCRSLQELSLELGTKEKVVYYSARKTFAQFASELGIPDNVIDYCLGHSTKSRGVIRYYTKVKQKQAEIAINRVIDYVNDPDKYKDYIEMKADIMMMKG